MTDELLELLWVLEATVTMEPDLAAALDAVVAGDCFTAAELPQPTEAERKPPRASDPVEDQGSLFEEPGDA